MKRKSLILTTVLLLVVGAVVLQARLVRYERGSVRSADDARYGLHFFRKRASWLPGPSHFVPPQSCGSCLSSAHVKCPGKLQIGVDGWVSRDPWGAPAFVVGDSPDPIWRCTCPDSRHGENR